jgi:predicted ester cyclase
MGMPAAGKSYRIGEMHFFRIVDGKVAEHSHQYDAAGQMKQLGGEAGG